MFASTELAAAMGADIVSALSSRVLSPWSRWTLMARCRVRSAKPIPSWTCYPSPAHGATVAAIASTAEDREHLYRRVEPDSSICSSFLRFIFSVLSTRCSWMVRGAHHPTRVCSRHGPQSNSVNLGESGCSVVTRADEVPLYPRASRARSFTPRSLWRQRGRYNGHVCPCGEGVNRVDALPFLKFPTLVQGG